MTNKEIKFELAKVALTTCQHMTSESLTESIKNLYEWIMEEPEAEVKTIDKNSFDSVDIKEVLNIVRKNQRSGSGICSMLEKQGEHKSVDKVEPKFKVGDWVVHNMSDGRKAIRQIVKMTNKSYVLDGGGFDTFYFNDLENDYHLWTIQDAKDGDVLATSAGAFIYNGNNGGGSCPGSYCGIDNLGKFKTGVEHHWTGKKVYPATKEQRDTLMETMADDGYTFDFEKKELKKIEQNSIEPDDIIEESYQQQANDVIDMVTEKPANIIQEDFEKYVEHLLSLSDGEGHGSPAKVKEVCYELLRLANLQQKPWSEEDEKLLELSVENLTELKDRFGNEYGRTGDCIELLKFLKKRCT